MNRLGERLMHLGPFFGGYIRRVTADLNQLATPHLELLDWEDMIALPQSFFKALALSPIRHLKLFRIKVDQDYAIEPPDTRQSYNWPLHTIHMETYGRRSTSMISASILRSCASSLEKLFLSAMSRGNSYTFISEDDDSVPDFPRLRHLSFGMIRLADASMLEALVTANIRSLDASLKLYPGLFVNRGLIPSLEAFACESMLSADDPLQFLRANPQSLKLAFTRALPSFLIESRLLPLLSASFTRLESLSMVWEGTEILESAIQIIGSFRTLKQLHLSAGTQTGWRYDWPIKHDTMCKHLMNLPQLEKLAFSRDSYIAENSSISLDTYY